MRAREAEVPCAHCRVYTDPAFLERDDDDSMLCPACVASKDEPSRQYPCCSGYCLHCVRLP